MVNLPSFMYFLFHHCVGLSVPGRFGQTCDSHSPLWINEISVEEHELFGERRWEVLHLEFAGDEGLNLKDHLFYFMTVNAT